MAKEKKCAKKCEKKPLTKNQIIAEIAEATSLSKKDVNGVLDKLTDLIKDGLKGSGSFTLHGLVKIEKKQVPAQPARKHVENPFKKGEFRDIPAKKACNKIKVRALKGLKDMV